MELTTGAILRRITETPLSTAAHKLATIILDGIAWKDGYNGLERGTAAFTLAHLAEKMGVSRQHLSPGRARSVWFGAGPMEAEWQVRALAFSIRGQGRGSFLARFRVSLRRHITI
jgi:hypothetical protein